MFLYSLKSPSTPPTPHPPLPLLSAVSWFTESSRFASALPRLALLLPSSLLQGLYCLPGSTMIFLACQVSTAAGLWRASCYFQILAFSGVSPGSLVALLTLTRSLEDVQALKMRKRYKNSWTHIPHPHTALKGCQSCLSSSPSCFRLKVLNKPWSRIVNDSTQVVRRSSKSSPDKPQNLVI